MMQTKITALNATTSAAALAAYDDAVAGAIGFEDAAHLLAAALRAPKAKAPTRPKATGFVADFVKTLKDAAGVVEKRNTIPILSNVRLTAKGGALQVMATNLDMMYRREVGGYVGPDFDTTIQASSFVGMLNGVESIDFTPPTPGEPRLGVMLNGGAMVRLPTLPASDFPVMQFKARAVATVDGATWREALAFVKPGISAEETRYYLNGVGLKMTRNDQSEPVLDMVSTDGSRMFIQTVSAPEWKGRFPDDAEILPRFAVLQVLKLIGDGDLLAEWASVGGEKSTTHMRFTMPDGAELTTKMINNTYPDYIRVIPRDGVRNTTIRIKDHKAFLAEVARFAALSQEKSRAIRIQAAGGEVTATLRTLEAGNVTGPLPAIADSPVELSVNAVLLQEMVTGPGVLRIGGPNDPIRFDQVDRGDRIAILMPLRT